MGSTATVVGVLSICFIVRGVKNVAMSLSYLLLLVDVLREILPDIAHHAILPLNRCVDVVNGASRCVTVLSLVTRGVFFLNG